ncbi:hypothetical protein [Rhodococcus globerulus]|uniref:hypothetical protein n=1 Tax=Rhodococcus globerulus TaxID=33008 RepID=UPI00301926EE
MNAFRRSLQRPLHALTVHSYSEYAHHLNGGVTTLIIDADQDRWFDLGHIPADVDVTIVGQSCAAVTGGSITAAGQCFLQVSYEAHVTVYEHAHVEAFDSAVVEAHGSSRIVGTDHVTIRASGHAVVFAHGNCHVHAVGETLVAATDTTTVVIDGSAQVRASGSVRVSGNDLPTNLTIDTRPISRLADHLSRQESTFE